MVGGENAGISATPDADGFCAIMPASRLAEGAVVALTIQDQPLLLTRYRGQVFAFSRRCPHAGAELSPDTVRRGRIDCPKHGYRFDIRSGRTLWPPDEMCRLKRYEVRENAGILQVRI